MTRKSLLSRLASLVGIEPSYIDIRGRRLETSQEAEVRVLEALGFDISSARSVAAAIRSLDEEPWRRWIAPFIVRPSDAVGLDLDLFLPAVEAADRWAWRLACESGETIEGVFWPGELPAVGVREIDGRRIEQRRLAIRQPVPIGYHRLRIEHTQAAEATLAVAPRRCYVPPELDGPDQRAWGLTAHLYTLRSERNWGVGDFGDLGRLGRFAGESGASVVATNPFHALFPRRPSDASPYSPSSRLFLNPIYIDIAAAATSSGHAAALAPPATLAALRDSDLVDYAKVWAAKSAALAALFDGFRGRLARGAEGERDVLQFRHFVSQAGAALQRFAAFSVLDELQSDAGGGPLPWSRWPHECRSPDDTAVQQLIDGQPERLVFHQYLQFLADRQLGQAAEDATQAGLSVGIVRDLALGVSPDGADTWMWQQAFAQGLRCGAPPDDFHPQGQEWGVVPLDPIALRRDYSPFVAMIRANMRHAGGLRIDHVIGLQRQFLMPRGERPMQGCYVRYPLQELLAILALESQRNKCMVIGEDLGTVPEGFRDRLRESGAFGCAVLYFEKTSRGGFKAPDAYPEHAVASAATHDLPTLAGYWEGRDVVVRLQLGIYDDSEAQRAQEDRRIDRRRLLKALSAAGFKVPARRTGDRSGPAPFAEAIHGFLASSSARLFLAQIEDLLGELDQTNVPGTTGAYPNWRRKLSVKLDDPAFIEAIEALARICRRHSRDAARSA